MSNEKLQSLADLTPEERKAWEDATDALWDERTRVMLETNLKKVNFVNLIKVGVDHFLVVQKKTINQREEYVNEHAYGMEVEFIKDEMTHPLRATFYSDGGYKLNKNCLFDQYGNSICKKFRLELPTDYYSEIVERQKNERTRRQIKALRTAVDYVVNNGHFSHRENMISVCKDAIAEFESL